MRGRSGNSGLIIFAVALLVLFAPSGAAAATVVNGGFESGTLNGWHVHRATEAGNWFAYSGTNAPIGVKRGADPVQAPPEGAYAGIADEANPDTLILYQDVALEPGSSQRLSLLAYYDSYEPIAIPTPNTLSVDDEVLGGQSNQQFRIDVMKPDAPLESVDPSDILRTVFQTKPGDPEKMPPTRMTADLTQFAGQTVRLRIATAVHDEVFNAGVDAVSVSSTGSGRTPSGGSKSPSGGSKAGGSKHGPILFSFGRVRSHRHAGIATLRVQVSGGGLLRAKAISAPSGKPGTSTARKLRSLIEPVTIPVSTAKTVTIHLRPTPYARAVLRQKHKLRVMVAVTYIPIGGPPEVASLPVVLKLEAHRRSQP